MRAFLNNRSGCRKNSKSISILPPKSQSCLLETEYLGNSNWYPQKLSSVPRGGNRDYFVAQIGTKSCLRRSKSCEKNSIPQSRSSPAVHSTFSAGYVRSAACSCGQYPVTLIVLDFWIKALFSRYGVICSPQTLLWRIPDFPDNQSAWSGSPCILTLGSIQQLQLLTAKLRSKHAIQAN